ncbi:MAG: methylmalonyl-CoA mutase family protein [Bacteroidota bacterium]|jgi:methylmalonyl-CoA mutase|nr:methylmalonyl-CoA mutase family protein [Bacteroidota bacterium]
MESPDYTPKHKNRLVTAASLFDGHDASINIMRRILQASGAEIIHLGHNRSVAEIVDAAIHEDVQGIAISSYQGGHMEFLKYMKDLLAQRGAGQVKIFAGGGGVIVPEEIAELHAYGIDRVFSPEDGRELGLQGMINLVLESCDYDTGADENLRVENDTMFIDGNPIGSSNGALMKNRKLLASALTALEHNDRIAIPLPEGKTVPVLGITGTGGAGKSSLTDEIVRRFLRAFPDMHLAILSVDPSKRRTGGALLGDRIRMNAIAATAPEGHPRVFMRSFATRAANTATSAALHRAIDLCKSAGYDMVIVETAGIGQSDSEIVDLVDVSMYVMTPEYGAQTQLEKIDMLDLADIVVLNKFEKRGAEDALRDIRKQYKRNHTLFETADEDLPVFPTIASQFNDAGTNHLFWNLVQALNRKSGTAWETDFGRDRVLPDKAAVIPPERARYLSEISDAVQAYKKWVEEQADFARKWGELEGARASLVESSERKELHISGEGGLVEIGSTEVREELLTLLAAQAEYFRAKVAPENRALLEKWDDARAAYAQDTLTTRIRDREIVTQQYYTTLSGTRVPKVSMPKFRDRGDILRWVLLENVPGSFPYTAGVFPFKRENEDPTRMFAGEGTPERTNRRFHFVSEGLPAARLSTAFDSVTLYGEDPDERPDIYGKIGNSGVSICTLDDMKKLYCGFDLCAPTTSVSMTINGPAPMILAMFMNTATDQQVEKWLVRHGKYETAQKAIDAHFAALGQPRPVYTGVADFPAMLKELGDPGQFEGDGTVHRYYGLGTLGVSGDFFVEKGILPSEEYERIRRETMSVVRGTVQADILKEDQAQNTCIFSTEFALRMMGDIQENFVRNNVRNYYSVSISGYHIAEAGANPISQLAFTLANGFTYVEYYLSRGMNIDDFAPNLSYFFSNGIDAEYAVIGRVARRIWSVAMKRLYGGNDRSQKLKYHIQTSGRSLHAMEIDFNDIRTTLQALYAIYDNCNSLHTNAYDEAITTPTEESVRRALAIQMIINRELGLAKNENPLQGAFIIEELTDLVEEAVLAEFRRISDRGGVLGAMETMYQRGKIQEESMVYEHKKHSGALPIVGVNMFLRPERLRTHEAQPTELIRSTEDEKRQQITNLRAFQQRNAMRSADALARVQHAAQVHTNVFDELLACVKVASLGQISSALYEVGGQYRRNM